MKRTAHRGFTLVELVIAVAVIGLLASVALPAYTDSVRRSQLPEAFTHLSEYRIRMEQYFQDNRDYGTGTTCASAGGSWKDFAPVGRRNFDFSCTLNNSGNGTAGSGYLLTATGVAGRAIGHTYTLDQAGAKATTRFAGSTVSGKACWAVRAGDC